MKRSKVKKEAQSNPTQWCRQEETITFSLLTVHWFHKMTTAWFSPKSSLLDTETDFLNTGLFTNTSINQQ